jgi:F420-dependent oxidoreductase-like protein
MLDTSRTVDQIVGQARSLQESGFAMAVAAQVFDHDALTLLALVGSQVPDLELATGVVPTYPRHPIALATQALTVQQATGGRLTLGIGLSHQVVIEGMFGYSFDKPARHMREYLDALLPLLRGEQVQYQGETLKAATMAPLGVKAPAPPVLLAALAPVMLKLAGAVADGTVTWMVGRQTLESHIAPRITAAAAEAGRPAPRIAVGLPVSVTADVDAARQLAATQFVVYGMLPSYQAMIEKEGQDGPAGMAIVGDEDTVAAQLAAIADAGATDFVAAPYGSPDDIARTMALLRSLISS